jgi:hypothetical protein
MRSIIREYRAVLDWNYLWYFWCAYSVFGRVILNCNMKRNARFVRYSSKNANLDNNWWSGSGHFNYYSIWSSITSLDWISGNVSQTELPSVDLVTVNISRKVPRDLLCFSARITGGNVLLEQMKIIPPSKILRISWNLEIHLISHYKIPPGLAAFINVDIIEGRFVYRIHQNYSQRLEAFRM